MLVLNSRSSSTGRRLRQKMQPEGAVPLPGTTCIIYVHGFNKDSAEARRQAERLHEHLQRRSDAVLRRATFGVFLWPATSRGKKWWSAITYPAAVGRAEDAGRFLGDYLRGASWNIVLVGHSLGARVALEAADSIRPRRPLSALILTGAAVGVNEMEGVGRFRDPMAEVEGALWCPFDVILRTVYRPGERLFAPFRPGPLAVGLSGEPSQRWDEKRTEVWDHRYWNEAVTAEAIVRAVAGRVSGAAQRHLQFRPLLEWQVE